MGLHRVTRGLDLPIAGGPTGPIAPGPPIRHVAWVADDFPGLKPRVRVEVGQRVRRGEPLLEDRAAPGVVHAAPGAGEIAAIHRGRRRALQSIVVRLSEAESQGTGGAETVALDGDVARAPETHSSAFVRALLVASGWWTAWRTRPFGRVPRPDTTPDAIFVTATDTNPLAPDPEHVLLGNDAELQLGLRLLSRLTDGPTYLCVREGSRIASRVDAPVTIERFAGPHPAGTAGFHIHRLRPASRARMVWTIGYQDVVAVGRLFRTGTIDPSRVVAVAGPPVPNPQLVQTRMGASVDELTVRSGVPDGTRWIAGSVLSGKAAVDPPHRFLGRYDVQLTAVRDDPTREFLGWLTPGRHRFSTLPIFWSSLFGGSREFTTRTGGSRRAMVPIGTYERVMPFDLLPTHLLRALAAEDLEQVERLGGLELVEEDLALCTFVDPGKAEYGPLLRRTLDRIEAEG